MANPKLYIGKLNKIKEDLKIVKAGISVAMGQLSAPRTEKHAVGSSMFRDISTELKKVQGDAIKVAEELSSDKKIDPATQGLLINDLEGIVETIRKMLKKVKVAGGLVRKSPDYGQDPAYGEIVDGLWQDWKKLEGYLPK